MGLPLVCHRFVSTCPCRGTVLTAADRGVEAVRGGGASGSARHCCSDPECAGKPGIVEAPLHEGRQEGLEPLDRAYDLSS